MYELLVKHKKRENYLKKLKTGFKCIKHGRKGSPHERWVSLNATYDKIIWKPVQTGNEKNSKDSKKSSEELATFTTIQKGTETKVFKRNKKIKAECCFSLIGDDRTLDLEFSNEEERNFWFDIFQSLLDFNREKGGKASSSQKGGADIEKVANVIKKFHFDIESSSWKLSKVLTKGTAFTEEDFCLLASAIEENPKIEILDLSDIKLIDNRCTPLARGITPKTKFLTTIILSNNELTCESATALSKSLTANRSVTFLDLSDNQIGDQGADDLARMFESNSSVKTILLDKNVVSDHGAVSLAEALMMFGAVERLSLNDNHIGNEGAKQLALTLKNDKSKLKYLELARNQLEFPKPKEEEENEETFSLEVSLFLAVDSNNYADVVLLTLQGADPNCMNEEDGKSPLHISAIRGDRLMLDYLIEHPYIDKNAKDDNLTTPLYCAMTHKQYDVVKLLLEKGADFRIGDKHKKTILHLAAEQGNKIICKELIEKYGDDLNVTTDEEMTPLHFAAQNLHKDVVAYLLQQDEKERKEFFKNRETKTNSPNANDEAINVDEVISYVNWQDIHNQSALHKVFLNGNPDIETAKLLVQHGADVSLEDQNRRTPLHEATEEMKQILLNEARIYMSRKGL
ncbi:hypothetical protein ABK040_014038 [Willaertia magna]